MTNQNNIFSFKIKRKAKEFFLSYVERTVEQISMVPKMFEPLKFDCTCHIFILRSPINYVYLSTEIVKVEYEWLAQDPNSSDRRETEEKENQKLVSSDCAFG